MKKLHCSNVAKLKLELPKELNQWIEMQRVNCSGIATSRKYYDYIDHCNGELVLRTFSIKGWKNGKVEWAEIVRRGEDMIPYFCHCDLSPMCGYWADYDMSEWDPHASWRWCGEGEKNKGWLAGRPQNAKEILEQYDPHHCYTKELPMNVFEYVVRLKTEPGIELLIKNGYAGLANCTRMLDKKAKTIEGILKVDKKWVNYLRGKGRYQLIACRKPFVKTEDDADLYAAMMVHPDMKQALKYVGKYYRDLYAYYNKLKWYDFNRWYMDYMRMAEYMKYPLDQKKVLFPNDLQKAHDKAAKEYNAIINEEKDKKLKEWVNQLEKFRYTEGELFIRPAATCSELIDESEQMSNCVRSYVDRYVNGLTAIFFIRQIDKPGKSLCTLELKEKTVKQCYAAHNEKPDPAILNFVANWKKEFALR